MCADRLVLAILTSPQVSMAAQTCRAISPQRMHCRAPSRSCHAAFPRTFCLPPVAPLATRTPSSTLAARRWTSISAGVAWGAFRARESRGCRCFCTGTCLRWAPPWGGPTMAGSAPPQEVGIRSTAARSIWGVPGASIFPEPPWTWGSVPLWGLTRFASAPVTATHIPFLP